MARKPSRTLSKRAAIQEELRLHDEEVAEDNRELADILMEDEDEDGLDDFDFSFSRYGQRINEEPEHDEWPIFYSEDDYPLVPREDDDVYNQVVAQRRFNPLAFA